LLVLLNLNFKKDISADLVELGKTPVSVISAGAKVTLIIFNNKNYEKF